MRWLWDENIVEGLLQGKAAEARDLKEGRKLEKVDSKA
jgi:hypothetical protein